MDLSQSNQFAGPPKTDRRDGAMQDIGFFFEFENRIIQLPINPEKLEVKYKGNNKTSEIIKLGEVNVLKDRKLADIQFDCFFPHGTWFPGIRTTGQFEDEWFYKDYFNTAMLNKKPLRFIVTGINVNMLVSVEGFTYFHQAGDHEDAYYTLDLKEYKPFKITEIVIPVPVEAVAPVVAPAPVSTPPRADTNIVIGSTVILNGRVHYDSYGAKPGKTFTNYTGKINLINLKGTHPYHVTTPTGSYLGWVKKEWLTLV